MTETVTVKPADAALLREIARTGEDRQFVTMPSMTGDEVARLRALADMLDRIGDTWDEPSPATEMTIPMSYRSLLREYAGQCAIQAAGEKDFRVRRVWMSREKAFDRAAAIFAALYAGKEKK